MRGHPAWHTSSAATCAAEVPDCAEGSAAVGQPSHRGTWIMLLKFVNVCHPFVFANQLKHPLTLMDTGYGPGSWGNSQPGGYGVVHHTTPGRYSGVGPLSWTWVHGQSCITCRGARDPTTFCSDSTQLSMKFEVQWCRTFKSNKRWPVVTVVNKEL